MYFDKVFEFRGLNLGDFRKIPFLELRCKFKQTVIDSEVFVVGGSNESHSGYLKHVEIYSKKTKKWNISAEMSEKL